MTFNVNFALAEDAPTIDAVAGAGADVIFLQETTPAWEAALRPKLSASHPHIVFQHHPGAGGLAVLSRFPLKEFEYLPEENWFPAARVVLDTGVGPLQVLNVHLRPAVGNNGSVVSGYFATPPVRRREIETFAASLDPSIPTLIVGDFNEHEGGRALRWLRGRGMRSALPEFSPYAQTWRWQTSVVRLGGRYDHIVYDPRLEPLSVQVRRTGRSDHLPVVGVFALADAGAAPSSFRERYP
jgi:endonuclease/exonuclease/phosphatase (EEP) superfamily protein YafD